MDHVDTQSPVDRVEKIMHIIAGKWRPGIIYALVMKGPLRFVELRRELPRVTQRMLTQQLRDLERHGLIERTFYEEIPPRVEYEVTSLGRSLHPISKAFAIGLARTFRRSTGHETDTTRKRPLDSERATRF